MSTLLARIETRAGVLPASSRARSALLVLCLVAYGGLLAGVAAYRWNEEQPSQVVLQGSRVSGITSSIAVLDQGGPPLIAAPIPYKQAVETQQTYPADATDDPGIYLVLPIAGHILGVNDPLSLLKWLFIVLMSVVVLAYPILFYLLFDSLVLSLFAPLAVVFHTGYLFNDDIYTIESWAVLLLLPVVLTVAKLRWRRGWSLGILGAVTVVASFASAIRSQAGLGVALAALAVAVLKERGWKWRTGAAVTIVVGYLLISPLAIDGVRAYSDSVAHVPAGAQPGGHPVWHNAYIGLGLWPNKWGIQWSDTVSVNAVANVDPKAGYLSPRYEQILRHLYFQILLHHPGYVARLYALKGAIVIHDVWKRFLPYLVLSPLVLLLGRRRRRFRREFVLILPTFVLSLVPPVLTVPWGYDNGVVGAAGLLSLLVICGLYLLVRDWITATIAARRPPETAAFRPSSRAFAACGLLLAGILALGLGATSFARTDTGELQNALGASLLIGAPQARSSEGSWTGKSLAGWDVPATTKATVLPGDTLSVVSSAPSQTPELTSPERMLPAGSFAIIANGNITGGGLELQAWNPETQAAIGSARYWKGQVGFDTKDMVAQFALTEPTRIQIRVADWTNTNATSHWVLRSIKLAKLPA